MLTAAAALVTPADTLAQAANKAIPIALTPLKVNGNNLALRRGKGY
jgi:hypothetical protein